MWMTLLSEQPLMVSLALGTLAAALIYAWLQTGKRSLAVVGLILALLIPLAWVVAAKIETDREALERLIYETAAAVQRNDHDAAIKVIGDRATKKRAKAELRNWRFSLAAVNKLRRIKIIEGTFPQEADVDMTVKVDVSRVNGSVQNIRVPRRLILKFQKTDDGWVVTDYQHLPMLDGSDVRPNRL